MDIKHNYRQRQWAVQKLTVTKTKNLLGHMANLPASSAARMETEFKCDDTNMDLYAASSAVSICILYDTRLHGQGQHERILYHAICMHKVMRSDGTCV